MKASYLLQRENKTNDKQAGAELGQAQLNHSLFVLCSCCSRYVAFVELIHLNDLLDNVTFLFSTNQKPRKKLTHRRQTADRKLTYRANYLPQIGDIQKQNWVCIEFSSHIYQNHSKLVQNQYFVVIAGYLNISVCTALQCVFD